MAKTTIDFAESTDFSLFSDIIDDALRSLRISGSLLLRENYAPPWSIAIPDANRLATLLKMDPGVLVVAFHLVEFGHCEIKTKDGDDMLLTAGELAICFGGDAHHLTQGKPSAVQSIEALLAGGPNLQRLEGKERNAGTTLLCGAFLLRDIAFNPLLGALPPILRASLSRPGAFHNLAGVARLMAEEIDRKPLAGGYIIERLLEALCAEAVRAYVEAAPRDSTGWCRAIKDPIVGRAIAAIHGRPAADWSVPRLAAHVAMSPSRFAARFSNALGESPMAYVSKWRINVACRQLSNTRQGVEQIAASVGYENLAAFSRAFKKHLGESPAAWRKRARPYGD